MLTSKIDYFQAFSTFSSKSLLLEFITELAFFAGNRVAFLEKPIFLGMDYEKSFKSPSGFYGGYSRVASGYKCVMVLPGHFLSQVRQWDLIHFLGTAPLLQVTRLDIAVDDYSQRVAFSTVRDAALLGNFAFVDSYKYIESSKSFALDPIPTVYFGSSKSNKLIRFYDAEALHGFKAHRWELQLRRQRAQSSWDYVLENFGDINSLISQVFGAIDFIDRSGGKAYNLCPRLWWWQSLIDESDSVRLSVPKSVPTLEKTHNWLMRQVSTSLALFADGYDSEDFSNYIDNLVSHGRQKMSPYHKQVVQQLKTERSFVS